LDSIERRVRAAEQALTPLDRVATVGRSISRVRRQWMLGASMFALKHGVVALAKLGWSWPSVTYLLSMEWVPKTEPVRPTAASQRSFRCNMHRAEIPMVGGAR